MSEDDSTIKVQRIKVVANEAIREIIEAAHMAGQIDAGVDPSYSSAQYYCNNLFELDQ